MLHADNGAVQAGGARSHNPNGVGGFQGTGGTAYPYRGAKFNVWEGGTRTPAICPRPPGAVKRPQRSLVLSIQKISFVWRFCMGAQVA